MRNILLVLLLAGAVLAGCVGDDESSDGGSTEGDTDGDTQHDGEHGAEGDGFGGFDGEPEDCDRIENPGPFSTDAGLLTGYETRVLDVVLPVDASFVARFSDDWPAVVDFIATMADDVYQRELQLEVNVVAVIPIPEEHLMVVEDVSTNLDFEASQKVIDDTKAYIRAFHPDLDWDLVYTLVGTSIAGPIAGQADCIGGAKFEDAGWGWGEALDIDQHILAAGPVGFFEYTSVKVILHEMAHILGAHHHYQWCGVPLAQSVPSDSLGACSIMTNAVDFASFYFSPINKAAIRGYADEVDL